jgi:hypothetical protein
VAQRDGGEEVVDLAVNVSPLEGDLRRATKEEIEDRLPGVTVESGPAAEPLSPGEGRTELAPALALALGGLVLLESLVAWLFGHHGRGEAPATGGAS